MYTSIPYSSSDFQCFENIGWHIGHYYNSCIIVYNTTRHDAGCSFDSRPSSFWDEDIQGSQSLYDGLIPRKIGIILWSLDLKNWIIL